ncbi:MAG TPA: nitrilase-related carbon-nitrogen hydrolase [Thermoleophilia bacterium]|nr:nitrilase-related carbon-nitrogen hydrolase [Thermoleophilia bacterium]
MLDLLRAVLLGLASGLLLFAAARRAWLGWLALAPLCAAVYLSAPLAAGAAALVFGVLAYAPMYWGRFSFIPHFTLMVVTLNAVTWGLASAVAALIWPNGSPAWGALIFPVLVVMAAMPGERGGGRLGNVLLVSQEGWLPAVHIAALGHDLIVDASLALSAAVPAMLLVQLPPSGATVASAAAAAGLVAGAVAFGTARYRANVRQVGRAPRVRVAAVSVDGDDLPGPVTGPAYRDVEGTIARYEPYMAQAFAQGARLVVLPEVAVTVRGEARTRWLDGLARWAAQGHATVVAGLLDEDLPGNQLAIADERGAIAAVYDKQHPVRGAEPPRCSKMPPALVTNDGTPVSAIICFDIDHNDLVGPIARAGGLLAVPTNDWRNFTEIHHRAAVWEAVATGVAVIRSAGHGVSSIYDAAGRVIARASSFDGPVVLVADVPVAVAAGRALPVGEAESSTEREALKAA